LYGIFSASYIDLPQYGEKLVEITNTPQGVTATFASGTKAAGSIIIGTDGPNSAVRGILLGPEKAEAHSLEVILYNMNVCYGDAEKALKVRSLHPMNTVALHPEKNLSVWISSECLSSRSIRLLILIPS
jgi:2-polyprenyl-6-methoxyphenol hydroxylase-like FAD-dependent oxidoreductase